MFYFMVIALSLSTETSLAPASWMYSVASMKSPLSLLFSSLHRPSSRSLPSQERFSRGLLISVAPLDPLQQFFVSPALRSSELGTVTDAHYATP